jgi:hypothetical protein
MITATVRIIGMYGGLAIAGLAFAWLAYSRRFASQLPDARVVTNRGAIRTLLSRWLRPLAIVLGLALFVWAWAHDVEYIVVTDARDGLAAERHYTWKTEPDLPLAPGAVPFAGEYNGDPVWVLNRSTRVVRVQSVQYGGGFSLGGQPFKIPPGTSAHFRRIDYVGPNDRPPSEIRDTSSLSIAFRDWLTWD